MAAVLDGGRVTLSGGGARRILYQDTCDPAQAWTTSHCQNQATPRLIIQNMTFRDGSSTGQQYDGGTAIRALSQYQNRPVYVSYSMFRGGACSNGGALSSIGVHWAVLDSLMTGNQAIGQGATWPAEERLAAAGPFTATVTTTSSRSKARSSPVTTPGRAAARSSSSVTTGPAPC